LSPIAGSQYFRLDEFTGRYAKDPEFWKNFVPRIEAVIRGRPARCEEYLVLDKLVVLIVGQKTGYFSSHPNHLFKTGSLTGGHITDVPLRDPMTMKPIPK